MSARVNSAVWLLSNAVRYFAATLSSSMPADDVSSCVVGGNRGDYRPNPISFLGQDFRVGPLVKGPNEGPPALEDAINLEFYRLKWYCKCVFTEKEARPKTPLRPVFRLPHARPSRPPLHRRGMTANCK